MKALISPAKSTFCDNGWWQTPKIRHIISPNYTPRPNLFDIRLLVVHNISLPAGCFGGHDVLFLFTNRLNTEQNSDYAKLRNKRLSAHFFIRRDGELIQFVSIHHIAWHAGISSWGQQTQCNNFSLGVELEGTDTVDYKTKQYQQLATLILSVEKIFPNIYVVGHCHIAPKRKTDPGKSFDWSYLFSLLGNRFDGRYLTHN